MWVINLWGAPSSGKSTTAFGLCYVMKINRMRVEPAFEYAKEIIFEKNFRMFEEEQLGIFAEQNHRLLRLKDEMTFAVTDSPLPLCTFYQPEGYLPGFKEVVFEQFNSFKNINFLLNRVAEFENVGRLHDEEQAAIKAVELKKFMQENNVPFEELDADPNTPNVLLKRINEIVKERSEEELRFFAPDSLHSKD